MQQGLQLENNPIAELNILDIKINEVGLFNLWTRNMEQKILHFVSVKTVMAKAAPVTIFAEMQKLAPAKLDPTVFTPNR